MVHLTWTLEQLKSQSLERVLSDVADHRAAVTVVLPDGREVLLEPKLALKPLPELEGYVPDGWKDALYAGE
ncbi:MAG: hypothetical protein HYV63_06965 [Candidatus Schekmanbacteria bacterium]|nr:hypothetical protein [Candidatus Schekmanbacteria bacterium]